MIIDGEGARDSDPTNVDGEESFQSPEPLLVLNETHLAKPESLRVQMLSQHLESMGLSVSEVESVLPCTSRQNGILLAQIKGGAEDAYWSTPQIQLSTDDISREGVDPHRVAKTWRDICDRQPMLRTFFIASVSDPACAFQQVILKKDVYFPSISQGPVTKSRLRPTVAAEDFPKPEFASTQPRHHLHLACASRYVVYATIYINRALMDDRSAESLGQLLLQAYTEASALEPGPNLSEYIDISMRNDQPDFYESSSMGGNSQDLCSNTPSVSSAETDGAAGTTPVKELHRLTELASQHHSFHHDNIESVVPVTDAQAYMLAVSELDVKSLQNKAIIKLSKGLDTARLARVCEQVVQHQALLRTIFVQEGAQL